MYHVDIEAKELIPLQEQSFTYLRLRERFDIQEWVAKTPAILGEDLLVIAKELFLPSGIRLDLLAIDRHANLVIIELKRESSGRDVEWQAIKYASYCSSFLAEDIFALLADYRSEDLDDAQEQIEAFLLTDLEELNQKQRLILVAQQFHSDVASAVLWLREYGLDIKCVRLQAYTDTGGRLFVNPEIIIPLPEAKDYIERKEAKQKEVKRGIRGTFSMEVGEFDQDELASKWLHTLNRQSALTPRFIEFVRILLSERRAFDREEIKGKLYAAGIGSDIGQTGRYLSGISQLLTKKGRSHLRQVITFESDGAEGDQKNHYRVLDEYRPFVQTLLAQLPPGEVVEEL
ncbi:MAG: DUF91 domain-containing protein [Anaerolineae bacterium]|nr:DUF91 domain-containing protein [Anaerolineae bacterium]